MTGLKLTRIGNSAGVILPKEVPARLKVEKAYRIFVTELPEGVLLTPCDPAVEEQLRLGREFMREFRHTFHQLAKRVAGSGSTARCSNCRTASAWPSTAGRSGRSAQ